MLDLIFLTTFAKMIQSIFVGVLFSVAAVYLGWVLYSSLHAKSCSSGCAKCGALDLTKIEKAIREKDMLLH